MTKFSKSQKKGKKSIYNSRYLKSKEAHDTYEKIDLTKTYTVVDLKKVTKSTCVSAVLETPGNKRVLVPAPESIIVGGVVNSGETNTITLKPLKDYRLGQKICAIQKYKDQNNYICCAAGTFATIYAQNTDKKRTTVLVKKRKIVLSDENLAMGGHISNSNFKLKPIPKAGIAAKIHYAKGKKYPLVSEHKKNKLDSCVGGSYRKSKRIKCVRHDTNPKSKTGHISPSRNGKRK